MKLIVISPESSDPREVASVREMFARGLQRYHVRKPSWSEVALSEYLRAFTAEERQDFVLHGHVDLVLKYGLRGFHWSDDGRVPLLPDRKIGIRSRACHDPESLRAVLGHFETVLLSPVFPSISKPGYGKTRPWADREIKALLKARSAVERSTEVFALGGIDERTTRQAGSMGFDGVAVLGAVWKNDDPVSAFIKISETCREFCAIESETAGRPPLRALTTR